MIVLLDAGPLGLLAQTRVMPARDECVAWVASLRQRDIPVIVPEIADYEVRRELLRIGSARGIANVDGLKTRLDYLPLTTDAMLRAAELWAQARRRGRPTATDADLDCDVILAAQALLLADAGEQPVIATTNVRHLGQFVDARLWRDITPDEAA